MADIFDQNGQSLPTIGEVLLLIAELREELRKKQEQPTFPITGINIPPDGSGMAITVVLAPGFQFTVTLGEDMMNQIAKQWVQTRKNIADQLRVIEHVKSTRLN